MSNNINQIFSIAIIDQLIKTGINQYYVSPGLRNAPLIDALTQFPNIEVITEIDERTAAYMAIGASKTKGIPSV